MTMNKTLVYQKNYTRFSREQLIERVRQSMSEKRFRHVLGVEQTAIYLAEKYGGDVEKVSVAALLHDIAKERPDEEMRDLVISENLDLDLLQYGNAIWHGPIGAVIANREYDVLNGEILEAIEQHTIGAPEMSLAAQIIFVADFIEPNRDFPEVEEARRIADESLAQAVKFEIVETIKHLIEKERKIYPKAIDTYNAWVER